MEARRKWAVVGVSAFLVYICVSGLFFGFSIYNQPAKRYVGAYYYPWYDGDYWSQYTSLKNYPSLGKYSSSSVSVLQQHLIWAEHANIDFLAVSWWNPDDYINRNVKTLFRSNHFNVQLCLMIEAYADLVPDHATLTSYADYIHSEYVDKPKYFCLYGKPLLIVYDPTQALTSWDDGRFTVRNVAYHTPYIGETGSAWQSYMGDFVTIYPGYDDTSFRVDGWLQERQNGGFYRGQWQNAVALGSTFKAKNLVCLITSFNEVPEQTFIEPSPSWDMLYLDITREYALKFKQTV